MQKIVNDEKEIKLDVPGLQIELHDKNGSDLNIEINSADEQIYSKDSEYVPPQEIFVKDAKEIKETKEFNSVKEVSNDTLDTPGYLQDSIDNNKTSAIEKEEK
jgi:hypothetical protein